MVKKTISTDYIYTIQIKQKTITKTKKHETKK